MKGAKAMSNKYFNLVEDSDLDTEEYKAQSWIWYCPECNAMFGSKAIHARTIFPWFGYHPNDGNCKVITDETARLINHRSNLCQCKSSIRRVRTKKLLTMLVEYNKDQKHEL